MAPELFNSKQYTKSVDIYSVGIIAYNMLTLGRHPFSRQKYTKDKYIERMTK